MIPILLVLLALVLFVGFMSAASWAVGRGIDSRTSDIVSSLCFGMAFGFLALGCFIPAGLILFAGQLLKGGVS